MSGDPEDFAYFYITPDTGSIILRAALSTSSYSSFNVSIIYSMPVSISIVTSYTNYMFVCDVPFIYSVCSAIQTYSVRFVIKDTFSTFNKIVSYMQVYIILLYIGTV